MILWWYDFVIPVQTSRVGGAGEVRWQGVSRRGATTEGHQEPQTREGGSHWRCRGKRIDEWENKVLTEDVEVKGLVNKEMKSSLLMYINYIEVSWLVHIKTIRPSLKMHWIGLRHGMLGTDEVMVSLFVMWIFSWLKKILDPKRIYRGKSCFNKIQDRLITIVSVGLEKCEFCLF